MKLIYVLLCALLALCSVSASYAPRRIAGLPRRALARGPDPAVSLQEFREQRAAHRAMRDAEEDVLTRAIIAAPDFSALRGVLWWRISESLRSEPEPGMEEMRRINALLPYFEEQDRARGREPLEILQFPACLLPTDVSDGVQARRLGALMRAATMLALS